MSRTTKKRSLRRPLLTERRRRIEGAVLMVGILLCEVDPGYMLLGGAA